MLELSNRDDSNEWSNIGFGEEITIVQSIEVYVPHLIWSSEIENGLIGLRCIEKIDSLTNKNGRQSAPLMIDIGAENVTELYRLMLRKCLSKKVRVTKVKFFIMQDIPHTKHNATQTAS